MLDKNDVGVSGNVMYDIIRYDSIQRKELNKC